MELSEVVNVQFAFPVVGVVLCAVLVFAFGFKSSVQPPSFDTLFSDDDDDNVRGKKKSKQKKTAVKVSDDRSLSPSSRLSVKNPLSSNKNSAVDQSSKTKTKKLKSSGATMAVSDLVINQKDVKLDDDVVGQWTTVFLKKNKKQEEQDGRRTKGRQEERKEETSIDDKQVLNLADKNSSDVVAVQSYQGQSVVRATRPGATGKGPSSPSVALGSAGRTGVTVADGIKPARSPKMKPDATESKACKSVTASQGAGPLYEGGSMPTSTAAGSTFSSSSTGLTVPKTDPVKSSDLSPQKAMVGPTAAATSVSRLAALTPVVVNRPAPEVIRTLTSFSPQSKMTSRTSPVKTTSTSAPAPVAHEPVVQESCAAAKLSFDELGESDWQEKTLKKSKKKIKKDT